MPKVRTLPEPAGGTTAKLGKVLDFMRLLWVIEHRLNSTSKRMHKTLGLTGPQRLALRVLEQFPGISAGELAHLLQLHPSTLTGIIERLKRRRLVRTERDKADRRRIRLQVKNWTHDRAPSDGTVERAVQRALRGFTPKEVEVARLVLRAIGSSLEDQ
jgi:DNA-binding MarR family transcriptional regulator